MRFHEIPNARRSLGERSAAALLCTRSYSRSIGVPTSCRRSPIARMNFSIVSIEGEISSASSRLIAD